MGMYREQRFCYVGSEESLGTSWTGINLSREDQEIHIENLELIVTSVSTAANLTYYLSTDAAGIEPIMLIQENVVWGDTREVATFQIQDAIARTVTSRKRDKFLYLQAKVDAGTVDLSVRVSGVVVGEN